MNIIKSNPTLEAANALSEVAMSAYPTPYRYLWENDDTSWYVEKCFLPDVFFQELQDPNAAFYVIEHEGQNIGFLKLNLNAAYKDYAAKDTLELERIYLLPEASGKGHGKVVMDFVVQTALAYAKKQILLKVMLK